MVSRPSAQSLRANLIQQGKALPHERDCNAFVLAVSQGEKLSVYSHWLPPLTHHVSSDTARSILAPAKIHDMMRGIPSLAKYVPDSGPGASEFSARILELMTEGALTNAVLSTCQKLRNLTIHLQNERDARTRNDDPIVIALANLNIGGCHERTQQSQMQDRMYAHAHPRRAKKEDKKMPASGKQSKLFKEHHFKEQISQTGAANSSQTLEFLKKQYWNTERLSVSQRTVYVQHQGHIDGTKKVCFAVEVRLISVKGCKQEISSAIRWVTGMTIADVKTFCTRTTTTGRLEDMMFTLTLTNFPPEQPTPTLNQGDFAPWGGEAIAEDVTEEFYHERLSRIYKDRECANHASRPGNIIDEAQDAEPGDKIRFFRASDSRRRRRELCRTFPFRGPHEFYCVICEQDFPSYVMQVNCCGHICCERCASQARTAGLDACWQCDTDFILLRPDEDFTEENVGTVSEDWREQMLIGVRQALDAAENNSASVDQSMRNSDNYSVLSQQHRRLDSQVLPQDNTQLLASQGILHQSSNLLADDSIVTAAGLGGDRNMTAFVGGQSAFFGDSAQHSGTQLNQSIVAQPYMAHLQNSSQQQQPPGQSIPPLLEPTVEGQIRYMADQPQRSNQQQEQQRPIQSPDTDQTTQFQRADGALGTQQHPIFPQTHPRQGQTNQAIFQNSIEEEKKEDHHPVRSAKVGSRSKQRVPAFISTPPTLKRGHDSQIRKIQKSSNLKIASTGSGLTRPKGNFTKPADSLDSTRMGQLSKVKSASKAAAGQHDFQNALQQVELKGFDHRAGFGDEQTADLTSQLVKVRQMKPHPKQPGDDHPATGNLELGDLNQPLQNAAQNSMADPRTDGAQ